MHHLLNSVCISTHICSISLPNIDEPVRLLIMSLFVPISLPVEQEERMGLVSWPPSGQNV